MENKNLTELSLTDLIEINGGVDQKAYDTGYAAGQVVGKAIKNFLTMTGIARLLSLI